MITEWVDTSLPGQQEWQEWHLVQNGEYTRNWLLRKRTNPGAKCPKYKYYYFNKEMVVDDDEGNSLKHALPLSVTNMRDAKKVVITLKRMQ